MGDKHHTDSSRSRTVFSREFFADYHTALLADIRADEACNDVYTGTTPHPIIELQRLNQSQILAYKVSLIAEEVLRTRSFVPVETFLHTVKLASRTRVERPASAGRIEHPTGFSYVI